MKYQGSVRQTRKSGNKMAPVIDLFRNHKLEFGFNLTLLKQSLQVFKIPQITINPVSGGAM
jgi:hypothetical protein